MAHPSRWIAPALLLALALAGPAAAGDEALFLGLIPGEPLAEEELAREGGLPEPAASSGDRAAAAAEDEAITPPYRPGPGNVGLNVQIGQVGLMVNEIVSGVAPGAPIQIPLAPPPLTSLPTPPPLPIAPLRPLPSAPTPR